MSLSNLVKAVGAVVLGREAAPTVIAQRSAVCRDCPSRLRVMFRADGEDEPVEVARDADARTVPLGLSLADFCGRPLRPTDDPPTCGCALRIKIRDPAAKCPQGRW